MDHLNSDSPKLVSLSFFMVTFIWKTTLLTLLKEDCGVIPYPFFFHQLSLPSKLVPSFLPFLNSFPSLPFLPHTPKTMFHGRNQGSHKQIDWFHYQNNRSSNMQQTLTWGRGRKTIFFNLHVGDPLVLSGIVVTLFPTIS